MFENWICDWNGGTLLCITLSNIVGADKKKKKQYSRKLWFCYRKLWGYSLNVVDTKYDKG